MGNLFFFGDFTTKERWSAQTMKCTKAKAFKKTTFGGPLPVISPYRHPNSSPGGVFIGVELGVPSTSGCGVNGSPNESSQVLAVPSPAVPHHVVVVRVACT